MSETGLRNAGCGADQFGFTELGAVHWNLLEGQLYEHAIRNGEATVVAGGALCAETGHHTGRSPKDKHTKVDQLTESTVWWDGNRKQSQEHFDNMLGDFLAHAKGKTLYAQDLYGGADPKYRIKVRVYTEYAWHSLFIRNLLIRPERGELPTYAPDLTIVDMPSNSDSTGGATPTAASRRSTACRDGSPAGAASQGSCRSARRSTGWSAAAAGWVRGSTSTSWSLIRWHQVRIDPPSSISSASRLVQSSTMATSTSPERTWRRPSPVSVCRSTRVSRG